MDEITELQGNESGNSNGSDDEPGWAPDPDDEWGKAVLRTAGLQIKKRRENKGIRAGDFGKAVGYSEDMVYKLERGERIPNPEFLDTADRVLGAEGTISILKENVKEVAYPKKVRDLKANEGRAEEIGVYESNSIPGLLQTREHAEVLLRSWKPPRTTKEVERLLTARMARKSAFERDPAPLMHFVLEEAPLRRQVGGTMAWRQQLEHLLEVGRLHFVTLQVMPTNSDPHPGLEGAMELFKFDDGTKAGRADGLFNGRPTRDPKQTRLIDMQYGTIRALALSPRESLAFIERLLGET